MLVLLIRTSVEYATERCGFVVGRFDFEMNDYPEYPQKQWVTSVVLLIKYY